MFIGALYPLAAGAAPTLIPATGPRTVKIEATSADPQSHPWGSDWKPTALEQWTAVLACEREGRVERCRFVDGVWWSVVVAGTSELRSIHLPAPGALELQWSPRGRLATWDVVGDRSAFWTAASNGMLEHVFREPGFVFKPDAQREIGQRIEQGLVRGLTSGLEWELPKAGATEGGWRPSQTPAVARRWSQSTASDDLRFSVTGEADGQVELSLAGVASERAAEDSLADLAVQTTVAGDATFDPQVGIVRARIETHTVATDQAPLAGHGRSVVVVTRWAEGEPTTPGEIPAFTLP
ncbi:MAG: hypothetical protein ABMA64_32955 [Myxococcota bacterium]